MFCDLFSHSKVLFTSNERRLRRAIKQRPGHRLSKTFVPKKFSRLSQETIARLRNLWTPSLSSCWLSKKFEGQEFSQISSRTCVKLKAVHKLGVRKWAWQNTKKNFFPQWRQIYHPVSLRVPPSKYGANAGNFFCYLKEILNKKFLLKVPLFFRGKNRTRGYP